MSCSVAERLPELSGCCESGLLGEPARIFVVLLHNDAKSSLQGTEKVAKLQKMTDINSDLFSARAPMPLAAQKDRP
jgi:hypothetical protein